MHKRLLLIMNPAAGVRKANRHLTAMVALFNAHGYICTVFCTAGRGDATRIARENARDFDLVVMGSRGRGRLSGLLLGSVSQYVLSHSGKPVLILPRPDHAPA